MTKRIGSKIKKAREDLGLTQSELAYRVGLSAQSISAFEGGRIEPSLKHLEKIARFTHQPVYAFTGAKVAEVLDRIDRLNTELAEIRKLVTTIREQDE